MSKETNMETTKTGDLPKNFPPELIPLYDFWKKSGKQTVSIIAAVAAVYIGYNIFVSKRTAAANAASEAVAFGLNSYVAPTMEEVDGLVAKHAGSKAEGMLKIRQAKTHFDNHDYEGALEIYDSIKNVDPAFAGIVKLGRAYTLEAKGDADLAIKAFSELAASEADDEQTRFIARIGAARVKGIAVDKEEAVKDLEAFKAEVKDDERKVALIDNAIDVVKRHQTLIEMAQTSEEAAKAAEKSAEEKPAEEKK